MRKILNSRLFRLLVCLILVCCFLVNSSPIKAQASLAAGLISSPYLIPVATVVAAALIAVGIMAGSDHTSFNEVVNNGVTWLTQSTSYVVNGMVSVLGFVCADGVVRSYVAKDLIQGLWKWAFDSGTVAHSVAQLPPDASAELQSAFSLAASKPYAAFIHYGYGSGSTWANQYLIVYSDTPLLISDFNSNFHKITNAGGWVNYWNSVNYQWATSSAENFSKDSAVSYFGTLVSEYSTLDGLVLGQIQAPPETEQLEDTEVYTDYIQEIIFAPGGVWEPDGEDKIDEEGNTIKVPCLPIRIPSIDLTDDVIEQTQEEAQSGETDLDFDFETSPDDGSGDGTDDTVTDPDSDSSGSWNPPKDPDQFMLVDLTKFFPFCIPFDLFEFFKLLHAEPVAPVLYWEIQDLAGNTYPLSIDLSEWDSVALLFRRLQLFLFVTGLAVASRKYIKW